MLTLQFDGLFRSLPDQQQSGDNAGFMCYGWVILRDQHVIARGNDGQPSTRLQPILDLRIYTTPASPVIES